MGGKQLLGDPSQSLHQSRRARFGPLKCLAVSLLVCFAIFQFPWRRFKLARHCHHEGTRYAGEHISWQTCGDLNGKPLECSEIDVPLDQFNPQNSGNKTFSIPLIRLRGNNATQNILLNPGGPGGSGVQFLYRRGEQLHEIVGEGFHLLTFDPRGVNGSKPLATCYPDKEIYRERSHVRYAKVIEDSAEIYTWSKNFGKACQETLGEHGAYVNTPQTAADMNSILDAVGQDDMVYWGFSYGTLLGQTYAALFPGRSKRVIIDGVVNHFDWYDNPFDWESLADTENTLLGFFDECVKAGENCSLSAFGDSKEKLWDKIITLTDELEREPLDVYINNTVYGVLDKKAFLYDGIFPHLYKPASWYDLADRLGKLLEGNATEAFLAYGNGEPWNLEGDANSFVVVNDGVSGPDHWPKNRPDLLDQLVPYVNRTLFGPTQVPTYYLKQNWPIPQSHSFIPKLGVETAHPLLILSTTFDPVCPLISARSANAAFVGSQIVELKTYGHCSVSMPSNCVAKHVRAFLYEGKVPANYTQCEVDGPYFIKPEQKDGKVAALKHFDDPEEQRIHLAQVQLASDSSWPLWRS